MKYLVLMLVFISSVAFAENRSVEWMGGSLTYHPFLDNQTAGRFANKVGDDGRLIANAMIGTRYTTIDELGFCEKYSLFGGNNSIGEPMVGGAWTVCHDTGPMSFGLTAGAYYQDKSKFDKRGIVLGVAGDIMPVFGVQVDFKLWENERYYIKENNFLSLLVTNHLLSFGIKLDNENE